jgi:hypothetical protein
MGHQIQVLLGGIMTGHFDAEDVGVAVSEENIVSRLLVLLHVELWLAY